MAGIPDHAVRQIEVPVAGTTLLVSGILLEPSAPRLLYVMAHGAGADMRHPFLETLAALLAESNIATLRYQFPYMEAGRKRPDPPNLLEATVRSVVEFALSQDEGLPLLAGGKSMGGRMTSRAAAARPLPGVRGLVFLGFPLHPPGRPGAGRAEHLFGLDLPMLFLQGTRDRFAQLDLLQHVCERLGEQATLQLVEGGDHSFGVLKRSGRTQDEVMAELAEGISDWAGQFSGRFGA